MDDTITIMLPYGYKNPTDEDVRRAKKFTKLRNDNAAMVSYLLEKLLQEYARKLTEIGYKYNCPPTEFEFSQDKSLFKEIEAAMDDLESRVLELVEEYSLNYTDDEGLRAKALPWMMALSSRGTLNLKGVVHERLTQFLYDTEAQVAAMKYARYDLVKAISRVQSTLHSVYSAPEVLKAYRFTTAARYLLSKGKHKGGRGLSSSGAVNVENLGRNTAAQVWTYLLFLEEEDRGADGFVVQRGSQYFCTHCDSKCGFHTIDEREEFMPPFHPNCHCYVIFVNKEE